MTAVISIQHKHFPQKSVGAHCGAHRIVRLCPKPTEIKP
jgi:hypothetical protein